MSLAALVEKSLGADGLRTEAKRAVDALPDSAHGKAVPFPHVDKWKYKAKHSTHDINEAIRRAPIVSVPLKGLHSAQHSVKAHKVKSFIDDPDQVPGQARGPHGGPVGVPIVVRQDGVNIVYDGNHRCTAALLSGETSIRARFVDFGFVDFDSRSE